MANIAVIGVSTASGVLTSNVVACKVTIGGKEVALSGCNVAPHGPVTHAASTVPATQSKVTVGGVAIVLEGDTATCGHPVAAGSSKVTIG